MPESPPPGFASRLALLLMLFLLFTYLVAIPGSWMPPGWFALVVLPIVPPMFLGALLGDGATGFAMGGIFSVAALSFILIGACNWCRKPKHLILAGVVLGIVNGLMARWCLFLVHAYAIT